jgi:recombination protein RecT
MTTTAIKARGEDPPVIALLKQFDADITQALPRDWSPGRFQQSVISVVRSNRALLNVEAITLVSSVLLAAQLGLDPSPGAAQCWIIPRRNSKTGKQEASMQVAARGWRDLAMRSPKVATVEDRIVREGDEFQFQYGAGGTAWSHRPKGTVGRDWVYVYCVARMVTGGEYFEAWTKEEVLAHRDRYSDDWKRNKAKSSWGREEEGMARKTLVIQVAKRLPTTPEIRAALVADETTPHRIDPDIVGLLEDEAGIIEGDLVDEDDGGES